MNLKKRLKIFAGKHFPITYSKILFRLRQGYKLNLKNPKTFNEKLMWLKIKRYFNNEIVWRCSDKFLVRDYAIKHGIKNENLPKLIGVFQRPEEIPYKKLPKKFALKCSHGCGFNIICTDKSKISEDGTNAKLSKWLNTKFGFESAENHYTHIKPCILVEEYIDSNEGFPYDYKIYCFNGVPKLVLVCSNREQQLKLNFYDLDWNEIFYGKEEYRNQKKIPKPSKLDDMLAMSKVLSEDFPFVRIDFYQYKGKALLGEMTFTPAQCMANYYSKLGDRELSALLNIDEMRGSSE